MSLRPWDQWPTPHPSPPTPKCMPLQLRSVPLLLQPPGSPCATDLSFPPVRFKPSLSVGEEEVCSNIFHINTLTPAFFFFFLQAWWGKNRPAFLKGKILQFRPGAGKYRLLNETELWKDSGPDTPSVCLKQIRGPAALSVHICKMPPVLLEPLSYQKTCYTGVI